LKNIEKRKRLGVVGPNPFRKGPDAGLQEETRVLWPYLFFIRRTTPYFFKKKKSDVHCLLRQITHHLILPNS